MGSAAIICHGGAGHSAKDQPGVDAAVAAGWRILESGGGALAAALAAVVLMEDDPSLNAGSGGRMRDDGTVQLDAAVMTSDGRLGVVTCIEETKNPILVAARLLDEKVNILAGRGARLFADSQGFPRDEVNGSSRPADTDTVGAVVRDEDGLIVVATSTGGCTGRPLGRVGDTPIIGAGFWCEDGFGVAATGIGEDITLRLSSLRVADRHREGASSAQAMREVIATYPDTIEVGFITLSKRGDGLGMANTKMPWASRFEGG